MFGISFDMLMGGFIKLQKRVHQTVVFTPMFFKNGRERVLSIYHHFTELIRLSKIDCEKFWMTPSGLDLTTFGSPFPCYSRWAILTHVEIREDSIVHIKIKDFCVTLGSIFKASHCHFWRKEIWSHSNLRNKLSFEASKTFRQNYFAVIGIWTCDPCNSIPLL